MGRRKPRIGDRVRLTDGSEGRVIKHSTDGVECWLVRTPGLDSWALLADIEAFL